MPTVALTFDDGPDGKSTPCVIDALANAEAPGTLFVRGEQFKHFPELLDDLSEAQCEVQAHCFSHSRSHRAMSRNDIEADIAKLLEELHERGILRPTLWRPPLGEITDDTRAVASALDPPLTLTRWDVASDDTAGHLAEHMCQSVMAALVRGDAWVREHSVVLLHDHPGASADRVDARETVRVVPMLVEAIRQAGGELAFHGSKPAGL